MDQFFLQDFIKKRGMGAKHNSYNCMQVKGFFRLILNIHLIYVKKPYCQGRSSSWNETFLFIAIYSAELSVVWVCNFHLVLLITVA